MDSADDRALRAAEANGQYSEQPGPSSVFDDEAFIDAVAPLTDGMLGFPAPFDLPSAIALAQNDSSGSIAEGLFHGALPTRRVGFVVHIDLVELTPGVAEADRLRRELVNTVVVDVRTLNALLTGLISEVRTAGGTTP